MNGREDKKLNDLFFVCSLIDYIARRTKNERKVVVNALGKDELEHLYDLADVYHSENIDKITHELINKQEILIMWLHVDMRFLLIGIWEKFIID